MESDDSVPEKRAVLAALNQLHAATEDVMAAVASASLSQELVIDADSPDENEGRSSAQQEADEPWKTGDKEVDTSVCKADDRKDEAHYAVGDTDDSVEDATVLSSEQMPEQ